MTLLNHRSGFVALVGLAALLTTAPCAMAQPIIRRANPEAWTLNISVQVNAWQERRRQRGKIPEFDTWSFEQTAVVFPVNRTYATADLIERGVTSRLTFNDIEIPAAFKGYVTGYHSGTRLGKWGLTNMRGRDLRLSVSMPYLCYETVLDEEAAVRATWPDKWPTDAASTFEPQMFIDFAPGDHPYDMEIIDDMVKKWTGGDTKQVHPLVAAKLLAGEVVGHIRQVQGSGLGTNRNGQLEGVDLRGVPVIAKTRRGNEFELVCYLASVYRRAGIPARTVIGWDIGEDDDRFLRQQQNVEELRSWVEFALFDPQRNQVVWVPVDILNLWRNRTRNVFRGEYYYHPLEHFGTLEGFNRVVPFAYQFHPPTTVRSYGSPAFWGWLMLPESPEHAQQSLQINAISTPRRTNLIDPPDPPRPDED